MHACMDTNKADSCADNYINYALQSVHCICRMRWVWYSTCAAAAFFDHVWDSHVIATLLVPYPQSNFWEAFKNLLCVAEASLPAVAG